MSEYLLPAEAAKRLHVASKTVSRWAREGKIPFVQTLGGHRRFDAEVIDRIAEEMRGSLLKDGRWNDVN